MRTLILMSVMFILLVISCKKQDQDHYTKTEIREKAIIEKTDIFIDAFHIERDSSQLDTILTDDYVRYMNSIKVASNPEELKASIKVFFTGFPDVALANSDKIIKDNHVFLHWVFTGTNTGVFGETPATGKKVKISGLSHLYFNDDGKMYREDLFYNELDLLQQLGYSLVSPIVK